MTHYNLGLNTNVDHIHHQVPDLIRQPKKSQIVVAEGMVVLIVILPKDDFRVWVPLNRQIALTISLL